MSDLINSEPRKPRIRALPSQDGSLVIKLLEKTYAGNKKQWELRLISVNGEELFLRAGVDWAMWDHRGRLTYTESGKLFAATIDRGCVKQPVELIDLTADKPESLKAPAWATSPERYPAR